MALQPQHTARVMHSHYTPCGSGASVGRRGGLDVEGRGELGLVYRVVLELLEVGHVLVRDELVSRAHQLVGDQVCSV